jgi:DNA-binding response OmpR family regulator
MRDDDFSLVVLDVCLPRMDGRAILKSIRRQKPFLPIIAVSSFQGDMGEAETLNAGADDFLSKPFSEGTFHARVKKALWHGSLATMDKESAWGHVRMNVDTRSTTYRGKRMELSEFEFNILLLLVQAQGRVVEANALERAAWGDVERFSMRLANKIKTLRNKFEALGAPRDIIDTNRGMGYVLREF